MKILVLNYEYPPLGGGAAPVCRDLAAGMAAKGHRVTVVTMGFPGLPGHEIRDGVEIFRVKCLRRKAHACMPWEAFSYILAADRFLDALLEKRSYDVCHVHFVLPTGPVALRIKKKYGIPYVLTAHGSDVEGYNQKPYMKVLHVFFRPVWRRIVRGAYAAAAPSEYLLKLMNREMKSRRYIRIPNGLEIEKYRDRISPEGQPESGCRAAGKEKRILLMGRMQPAKNFRTVFRAIALIPDERWDGWSADVLGDGPYREELEKLCAGLGITSRVNFRGWIENGSPEQLEYLKKAAVYISASHFENCPMAVLEAMAAGCLPLLSDIEGHRQFLEKEPEESRYFFRADDAKELARKLEALIRISPEDSESADNPEGPEDPGTENQIPGIRIEQYSLKRITGRYLKLLENAKNDGRKSRGQD